jgi:hypothetical protein
MKQNLLFLSAKYPNRQKIMFLLNGKPDKRHSSQHQARVRNGDVLNSVQIGRFKLRREGRWSLFVDFYTLHITEVQNISGF